MTLKIFISSTSQDLEAYRRAAWEECNRLGMLPLVMELFEAMAKGATAGSQRKLDDADLYVGLFANRYGFIEAGHEVSVTEREFDYAGERGLDRLCFLVQPGYAVAESVEDDTHRSRLDAFKRKVERAVIRAHFTTVDDFRGKVRLALQEWQAGDAKARLPQPVLTSNVLEGDGAGRLTYRARRTPFVGRAAERVMLDNFLAAPERISWLVVSGGGGVGKSRLVQEFCLAAAPAWHAGFLAPKQSFDWAKWEPNADTLIAVDYAAERVGEIRSVISTLVGRPDPGARVRLLLIERESRGAWMQELVGGRSDGYAIEQVRSSASPIEIRGLAPDELWAAIRSVLRAQARRVPAKASVLNRLHEIDPDGRPLFAALAADALAAGRDLQEWDRDRLLRDVLERERQSWTAADVPETYPTLLALATAVGGDTERMLEVSHGGLELPTFREFDRERYHLMTGCGLEGDQIPGLKPDLLGEFFVLEQVKGRNQQVTALRAAALMEAAWQIRGGTSVTHPFGVAAITYLSPSSLILFLTRVVEDFPDHPATLHLLRQPKCGEADQSYWATLIALAIRRYAIRGDHTVARTLFDELSATAADQTVKSHSAGGLIRAGLYLIPILVKQGNELEAREFLRRVRSLLPEGHSNGGESRDFCEAAAEAVALMLKEQTRSLIDELIDTQSNLVLADPENQDLRLAYARTLAAVVKADGDLAVRERSFKTLLQFCEALKEDVTLYEPLARAALALGEHYASDPNRLADAELQNRIIRGLARKRAERRLYRFRQPFSLQYEWVEDDLRTIRLCLVDSNAELVEPWTLAERFKEASDLIDEVMHIWTRFYRRDLEFALRWAGIVVRHADARERQGATEQVLKAFEALQDAAAEFDGDSSFFRLASELGRAVTLRAANSLRMADATEVLAFLHRAATQGEALPDIIADYAEAAYCVCLAYQKEAKWEQYTSTKRDAAWAIRSEPHLARLRQRGVDQSGIDAIMRWTEAVQAMDS